MPDGRRFDDSIPQLDPITESHWDRLNGEERADLLRRRHAQVISVLSWNVDATRMVVKRVDEAVMPMLEANTAATARTETKVEEAAIAAEKRDAKLDLLVQRTDRPLAAWQNLEGTSNIIGWIGTSLKNVAWVVLPLGMLAGGAKAFWEWAKLGFPGVMR